MGLRESERIAKILVDPKRQRHRLRLRRRASCGATATSAASTRPPTAARRWTQMLKGANPSTGCSIDVHGSEEPGRALRRHVGLPPQGLDVPLRRRRPDAPSGSGLFKSTDGGETWTELDGDQGPAGASRGDASRWPLRRRNPNVVYAFIESDRPGALSLRRRRQDLGGARPQPVDGLAAVLLREPDRRPEESRPSLQAGPASIVSDDGGKSFIRRRRRRARRLARPLDRPAEHHAHRSAATTAGSSSPSMATW